MIAIRGAREHNLTGLDLTLAPGQLTLFVGPSGSGKSSLAFDTLHAEAQRRYLEALGLVGDRRLRRPAVDLIVGLPPTLALDQRAAAARATASVASLSGLVPFLRVLWGRCGALVCPTCGAVVRARTVDEIVGALLRRPPGARLFLEAPVRAASGVLDDVRRAGFSRLRVDGEVVRIEDVNDATIAAARRVRVVVDRLKVEPDRRERLFDATRTALRAGDGALVVVDDAGEELLAERPRCGGCARELPRLEPSLLGRAGACADCAGTGASTDDADCAGCGGTGLGEVARAVRLPVDGVDDAAVLRGPTLGDRLRETVSGALAAPWPEGPVATLPVAEIRARLARVDALGVDVPLVRRAARLSGGERSRLRVARTLGAGLGGVMYVLDEPCAGLDDAAAGKVAAAIRGLVAEGASVVVVDHHPAMAAVADRVVEFGPGAGTHGGRIVFDGTPAALWAADTATGRAWSGRAAPPPRPARGDGEGIEVAVAVGEGTRRGRWPWRRFVVAGGPSASGKSRLLTAARDAAVARDVRVVEVDASPLPRNARSTPATLLGIWDVLRDLLAATADAKVRGLGPGVFSLAQKGGRCEVCQGSGQRRIALDVLPDVFVVCETCGGRRFAADVLEVRWKGRDAAAWLDTPADEARVALGGHPKLEAGLRAMVDVGLGHLPLGLSAHALSGGEAQRLRLARELQRGGALGTVYALDAPTIGLHPVDVARLVGVLHRIVEEGGTVWIASADPTLAGTADVVL